MIYGFPLPIENSEEPKDFWTYNDKLLAEDFLKKWYYWASHSQIEPIIDAAKTIKSHWTGIINYAETKISNGVLEGINSMVQSAKSRCKRLQNN